MSADRITLTANANALADAAALHVATALAGAIAERGRASLVLAGGSTPRALYERLANAALIERTGAAPVDWSCVDVFFGDERVVPPGDGSSNYRMARQALLDRVALDPARVHRIEGERPAAEAAARYGATLDGHLPFDLVLLGMGDDGHTASLFAARDLEPGPPVVVTTSPVAPTERVSLSLETLCATREIVFLVSGTSKAARLAQVWRQRREGTATLLTAALPTAALPTAALPTATLPAARVTAAFGTVHWFVDEAAAAELPTPLAHDAADDTSTGTRRDCEDTRDSATGRSTAPRRNEGR